MLEKGKSLKTRPVDGIASNREASSLDRRGTGINKNRNKDLGSPVKAIQRKNNSASFMQIYVLEEQSCHIQEYTSLEDFKKKRLLQHKSGLLKGCIDRNGALGTIKVRPFSLSIKSLDSDFEFSRTFKPNQWSKLAGIM